MPSSARSLPVSTLGTVPMLPRLPLANTDTPPGRLASRMRPSGRKQKSFGAVRPAETSVWTVKPVGTDCAPRSPRNRPDAAHAATRCQEWIMVDGVREQETGPDSRYRGDGRNGQQK